MHTLLQKSFLAVLFTALLAAHLPGAEPMPQIADLKPDILRFDPFTWPDRIPETCPFERSKAFNAIRFLGVKSGFRYGDTWYPTWAENDILYSPWTDGITKRLDSARFGMKACCITRQPPCSVPTTKRRK